MYLESVSHAPTPSCPVAKAFLSTIDSNMGLVLRVECIVGDPAPCATLMRGFFFCLAQRRDRVHYHCSETYDIFLKLFSCLSGFAVGLPGLAHLATSGSNAGGGFFVNSFAHFSLETALTTYHSIAYDTPRAATLGVLQVCQLSLKLQPETLHPRSISVSLTYYCTCLLSIRI
jgi:hypothetical protein